MTAGRRSLIAATANPHKLDEIRAILGDRVEVVARPGDVAEVVEDRPTLVGNATKKAAAIFEATGTAAIADDTGLEVPELGGEPGVRSARYAGEDATDADNVAKLLHALAGSGDRRARFVTAAVFVDDGGVIVWTGVCEGTIAEGPRGTSGFGYDPVFVPSEGDGRTFAEMTAEEKHAISHRGRAFDQVPRGLAEQRGW